MKQPKVMDHVKSRGDVIVHKTVFRLDHGRSKFAIVFGGKRIPPDQKCEREKAGGIRRQAAIVPFQKLGEDRNRVVSWLGAERVQGHQPLSGVIKTR